MVDKPKTKQTSDDSGSDKLGSQTMSDPAVAKMLEECSQHIGPEQAKITIL
jgi:hypothetical protein